MEEENGPAIIDFPPLYRGDTLRAFVFDISDTETGLPVDIVSARMQLRRQSGGLVQEWISPETISVDNGRLTFERVLDTSVWPVDTLRFDIEVTTDAGDRDTLVRGNLLVREDITHD